MQKNIIALILFLETFFAYSLYAMEKVSFMKNRPEEIQQAVDKAFYNNKDNTQWGYNGSFSSYRLFCFDKKKLLKKIFNSGQQNINIVDFGCGQGRWGQDAAKILRTFLYKDDKNSGLKQVSIFNITGGIECLESKKESFCEFPEGYNKGDQDSVSLHWLEQVKIENIDEELKKRGIDLADKCDLIVSHWTMNHLVDPFGTLKKLYSLLRPGKGIFASTGFLYKADTNIDLENNISFINRGNTVSSDKSEEAGINTFPLHSERIALLSNASFLFNYDLYNQGGDFVVKRTNNEQLKLPLLYTGDMFDIDRYDYDVASGKLTVFKLIFHNNQNKPILRMRWDIMDEALAGSRRIYYEDKNQSARDLFNDLEGVLTNLIKIKKGYKTKKPQKTVM